jgi:rod shape-determining protein MreC
MALMRTQKELRQRAPVLLVVLLLANFGLMTWDARDEVTRQRLIRVWAQAAAAPAQSAVTGAGGAGVGFFQRVAGLWGAQGENERLKERLAEIEVEARNARAALDENERLKALVQFGQDAKYKSVAARVISRDPTGWFGTVVVNRGTSSGVEVGMPVATPDGIVGRVVAASPISAQVTLITDDRAAAGAVVGQLGQSNALGVVRGVGTRGLLEMKYVSGLEQVAEGDYVVTTGQDGIYPPGLNVGSVVEVRPGSVAAPHQITVKPSARLDSLQEVLVLLYKPPPRAIPTPTPSPEKTDKGKKP